MRSKITAVFCLALLCAAAPPPSSKPKTAAPDALPHSVAMFLSSMCGDGKQRVSFKAAAFGTRFFIEESTGVSVYSFDGIGYRRQAFLKGTTLGKAMQKYRTPSMARPAPPKTKP